MKWALWIAGGLALLWWLKSRADSSQAASTLPMIWINGPSYQPTPTQAAPASSAPVAPVIVDPRPAPITMPILRGVGGSKILRAYPVYSPPEYKSLSDMQF